MSVARNLKRKTSVPSVTSVEIKISREILFALGWKRVVAKATASDSEIRGMMRELQSGNYSHTWRWFNCEERGSQLERLREFENNRRSTELYFYFGETGTGVSHFIGAGAIAEKISHAFPYLGFPVVSRCYILDAFRGNRFYEPFLQHRISQCRESMGGILKGIHLGTSNARVFASLRKGYFESRFLYLGDEQLEGNHDLIVKDFLLFENSFRSKIERELEKAPSCSSGTGLREQMRDLFEMRNDQCFFHRVRKCCEGLKAKHGDFESRFPALSELITLMESIPVSCVSQPTIHTPVEPQVFARRTGGGRS